MSTDILIQPVWESSFFNEKLHTSKYMVIINNTQTSESVFCFPDNKDSNTPKVITNIVTDN